jgi:NDP-4-keto-2,6-dideoxyhexose 3-C-methyltransferase
LASSYSPAYSKNQNAACGRRTAETRHVLGGEDACGLLRVQHTCDLGELYGDNYGYRSELVTHHHAKVRKILQRVPLPDNALVIDIGANDSTTLQAYPARGCTLVGVDPTSDKFRRFYLSHIQPIPDFFSAATMQRHFGSRKAAVITSFSMFYDLEQPLHFMMEVAEVLDDQRTWVLEQSYMPDHDAQELLRHCLPEHLEYPRHSAANRLGRIGPCHAT